MRKPLALGLVALAVLVARGGDLEPICPDSGFAWLRGADGVPHEVDRDRVIQGIPGKDDPRDVIEPIDEPGFYESVEEAEKVLGLAADERVLGLRIDGAVRAYPVRILDRHEIVNDRLGETPVGVIW